MPLTLDQLQGLWFAISAKSKRKLHDIRGAVRMPVLHLVYENKRQPDGFGANRYAYELLQLPPFSPINRAVRVRRQISYPFEGPQVWSGLSVRIAPIPSQSGAWFTGGMVQSDGSLPPTGVGSAQDIIAVSQNDVSNPVGANDPSPVFGPNDPMGGYN